jgi:predicted RNA-binding Zn ribbon-like protein
MNTIWADNRGVHDELTDVTALREWLGAVTDYDRSELGKASQDELNDALLLRDSLRRLAAYSTRDVRPSAQSPVTGIDEAVDSVNRLLANRPRTLLTLSGGQLHAVSARHASPTRCALADLGHDALELLTGPRAVNLRACNAPGCVLYFVKSHPRREWCSESCGNRVRAARHYQRTRARDQ